MTSSLGDLHTIYLLGGGEQAWGDYTCTATNSRGSRSSTVRVSGKQGDYNVVAINSCDGRDSTVRVSCMLGDYTGITTNRRSIG